MQGSLIHIDWVDLDNIIIISSIGTYYKRFLEQVKDINNKVRIIELISKEENLNCVKIRLVTEINSNRFLNIYKQFNREIILNDILKC